MEVRDIMKKKVQSVSPETPLAQVAQLMKTMNLGSLPVLEGQKGVGFVTDRDLAIRALAEGLDPTTTKVSEIMSKRFVTCEGGCSLEEACRLMRLNDVRRLLIVDQRSQPIGIVSLGDIAEFEDDANVIRETMHGLKHH